MRHVALAASLLFLGCRTPAPEEVASPSEAPQHAARWEGCPRGMARVQTPLVDVCVDVYETPGFGAVPESSAFEDARAACERRQARLCTEQEWEIGCRGPEGHLYPYGDSFNPERCVTGENGAEPVGTRNLCRSGFGLYDMSGNAGEWVEGAFIKGGGYDSDAFGSRCGARARDGDASAPSLTGFRCCRAPE